MASIGMGGRASIVCAVAGSKLNALHDASTGAVKVRKIGMNISGAALETTGVGDSGTKNFTSGLKECEFTVESVYPRAAPNIGASFLLTWTGGPTFRVKSITLDIDFGTPVDITTGTGTAQAWKEFCLPQECSWTMQVEGMFDASAAPVLPPAANDVGTAFTLKLCEGGANDPTISGFALISGGPVGDTNPSGPTMFRYTISPGANGALTFAAGSGNFVSILPAGALSSPQSDWDANGDATPDITTVVTLETGRTITAPMALTRLSITDTPDGLIGVNETIKVMGAPTFA